MQLWTLLLVSCLENSPFSGLSMDLVTFLWCCIVIYHLLELWQFSGSLPFSPLGIYSDVCVIRWGPHLHLKVKARLALDAYPFLCVLPPSLSPIICWPSTWSPPSKGQKLSCSEGWALLYSLSQRHLLFIRGFGIWEDLLPDEGNQTVALSTATIPHNRQGIVGQGASLPTGQPVCTHSVHDWGWLIISVNCMSVFQQVDCTEHGLIPFSQ